MKNNLKIAVTGGSGFIGTRLIKTLNDEGHETNIIDIADKAPIDILDQDALDQAVSGKDVIYHLAAEHRDDVFPRARYYDVNGEGTQNVVNAAEKAGVNKIIFTSSVAVYALGQGAKSEDSPVAPFNDYGKSKLEAEEILIKWARADKERSLIIIRPAVVFGENNRGNVYNLINQIAKGRFLMIGRGQNKKSMGYVGNVAAFLKYSVSLNENVGIYNYADKPDLTTQELIGTIYQSFNKTKPKFHIPYIIGIVAGMTFDVLAKITGKTFPISAIRVKKFCSDTVVDADKVMKSGFTPLYTMREGVERMIKHDFKN